MARALKDIYQQLIDEKNTMSELSALQPNIDSLQTLLDDLTTNSKVGVWRLYFWIVAFGMWTHEVLWDAFKAEITALVSAARPGTRPWYQEQALKFQYGHTLVYIDGKFQYSVVDDSAKIVKLAAVVVSGSQVIVKVAKLSGATVVPLSAPELTAFDFYMHEIMFAGTNLLSKSEDADELNLVYKAYYDPLVLNSSGALLTDPTIFPLEDAIKGYVANLPFNGELVLTKLTDAAQKAEGISDPVLQSAEARYGAIPFAPVIDKYLSDGGHMKVTSLTITYIAIS